MTGNRKKLLDPVMRTLVARGLRPAYPNGPDTHRYRADVAPRVMLEDIVNEISAVLAIVGEPVSLAVETERLYNELPIVKSLVVYIRNADGDGGRTITIPMTVTRNLCTIAGTAVYLETPNAAPDLMTAVLDAASYALATHDVGDMAARVEAIINRASSYDSFDEEVF